MKIITGCYFFIVDKIYFFYWLNRTAFRAITRSWMINLYLFIFLIICLGFKYVDKRVHKINKD